MRLSLSGLIETPRDRCTHLFIQGPHFEGAREHDRRDSAMNSSAHSNELGERLPLQAGGPVLRDHYAALGVTPEADHEVIKAAFRALAKKYHPDKLTLWL